MQKVKLGSREGKLDISELLSSRSAHPSHPLPCTLHARVNMHHPLQQPSPPWIGLHPGFVTA